MYYPTTKFISEVRSKLLNMGMPIRYSLPEPSIEEPFIVIGQYTTNDDKTAKNGYLIEDIRLQVDIFIDGNLNRLEVEETRSKARKLIGKYESVTSRILKDDTIGREVYHIVFFINHVLK